MKRYKNLLEAEAVTQQQYNQVKTEYEATKASYEALLNQKAPPTRLFRKPSPACN